MDDDGYTFGRTPTAADRLLVLARVFDPSMAAVLADLPARRWRRLADLGCGPASSTERLVTHVEADEVVGVDGSAEFCARASERLPGARFVSADVRAPLPVDRPDLVYARFLLSHLPAPRDVAAAWVAQLAPDGFVVLEEPESIDTDDEVFRRYLALTTGMVASRGAEMFVGPALAGLPAVLDRVWPLDVSAVDAATMFSLNLATVRTDPWVEAHHDVDELDELAAELRQRMVTRMARPPVRWRIRQLVLAAQRPASGAAQPSRSASSRKASGTEPRSDNATLA